MNAVDELRRAANLLREHAEKDWAEWGPWATEGYKGGDWSVVIDDDGPGTSYICDNIEQGLDHGESLAAYIALMHPPVALALADWLDDEALPGLGRPDNVAAYAVARAVLREAGE